MKLTPFCNSDLGGYHHGAGIKDCWVTPSNYSGAAVFLPPLEGEGISVVVLSPGTLPQEPSTQNRDRRALRFDTKRWVAALGQLQLLCGRQDRSMIGRNIPLSRRSREHAELPLGGFSRLAGC